MKTKRKLALVTGASGKIGSAVARELAQAGYDLVLQYRRGKALAQQLAEEIAAEGCHVLTVQADLSKRKDCEEIMRVTYAECGEIDAFIHTASEFKATPLAKMTRAQWDTQMEINLACAFFLSKDIGLRMKKGRGGAIIHFSDIAAHKPYAECLPYCMAKAAIETMVKGLAVGLAPRVRVNAIAPYMVRAAKDIRPADRALIKKMPLARATDPREIARLVRMLTEHDSTITGEIITVDGGRRLTW